MSMTMRADAGRTQRPGRRSTLPNFRPGLYNVLACACLSGGVACGGSDTTGPAAQATVDASGGTVKSNDGAVALTIPPGSLSTSTTITIASVPGSGTATAGFIAHSEYAFSPAGTQLNPPASLKIRYIPRDIPAGYTADHIVLQRATDTGWQPVFGGSVDTAARTVTAPISTFSSYGLVALPHYTTLSMNPSAATLWLGQSLQLKVHGSTGAASSLDSLPVIWTLANAGASTKITPAGLLVVGPLNENVGMVKVTGTLADGEAVHDSVNVINNIQSITLAPADTQVFAGTYVIYAATILDPAGHALDMSIIWSSSNDSVATFPEEVVATTTYAGTATVTASWNGRSGSAHISVVAGPTTLLVPTPAAVVLRAGGQIQIALFGADRFGNPTPALPTPVSCASGASTVATCSGLTSTGPDSITATITAGSAGAAIITFSAGSVKKAIDVTVQP